MTAEWEAQLKSAREAMESCPKQCACGGGVQHVSSGTVFLPEGPARAYFLECMKCKKEIAHTYLFTSGPLKEAWDRTPEGERKMLLG